MLHALLRGPLVLAGALFLGLPCAAQRSAAADGAPENVLILLADDIGVDYIASYGVGANPATTPNLDALAAGGVQFRNAWTSPVCSPTRALIQTGRYGFRTGLGYLADAQYALPLSEVTLPEMLDAGTSFGWDHAAFGKWHLGNAAVGGDSSPNMAGWSHFAGSMQNLEPAPDDYFSYTKVVNGASGVVSNYATTETIDDALAWIATAQEPWVCYIAFHTAHSPLHAPPAALHTVDLASAGPIASDPVPYYRAMIEAMDTEIGRLLTGLGSSRASTHVVFLGDNGTPSDVILPPFDPKHSKGRLYEGGVNVPFLVSGPAVVTPGESQALVNAVDVFATVAEIAGVDPTTVVPPGTKLDGISFLPHVADPNLATTRTLNFAEVFWPNGPSYAPPVDPPMGTVCQPDLGFAGPGSAALSVCGGLLVDNDSAELLVSGAPPSTPIWLVASIALGPVPLLGGTLAPNPPVGVYNFATDANGDWSMTLSGYLGPATLFIQAVVLDLAQPQMFGFTNTVQTDFLAPNSKAVRDVRYKLISSVSGGPDEFFDLQVDPLETSNLLKVGLTAPETEAFVALKLALGSLITTP